MKPELLISTIENCARETGAFIREESRKMSFDKADYKGINDLVTYVDKASEKRIISALKEILPEASILAEESGAEEKNSPFKWVIDPLDGTTNFVHGVPAYSVSIGLLENEKPILGVIYEVSRDECFSACEGKGAFLNGKRIRVSGQTKLKDCLMSTGFPVTIFDKVPVLLRIIGEFIENSHGVRRTGSAALDLAYVAAGRFDGFFEYNLNAWDVAAGIVIVREAGGIISDFHGGDNFLYGREILAGNQAQSQMLDQIRKHWH